MFPTISEGVDKLLAKKMGVQVLVKGLYPFSQILKMAKNAILDPLIIDSKVLKSGIW